MKLLIQNRLKQEMGIIFLTGSLVPVLVVPVALRSLRSISFADGICYGSNPQPE
jgi:hypothetical protein